MHISTIIIAMGLMDIKCVGFTSYQVSLSVLTYKLITGYNALTVYIQVLHSIRIYKIPTYYIYNKFL